MNRADGGFALITVLWIVAALAMLVTVGLADSDIGRVAAENRLLSRRALWAERACLAVARARLQESAPSLAVDSADLGGGVWCRAIPLDPAARVNPNLVDSAALARVLGDVSQTAAILDWIDADDAARDGGAEATWYRDMGRAIPRNAPLADVAELPLVRGLEHLTPEQLDLVFTVRGDGRIDPNRAPVEVLRALTALPTGSASRIARVRRGGTRLDDAEEVATASGARLDAAAFRALVGQTVFDDHVRVVRLVGGATRGGRTFSSASTATLLATQRRSVTRIEVGR